MGLPTFQEMWISKQEFDEAGPGIVHRKCFQEDSRIFVISIHSFERFFSFYFLLTRSRIHHIILIRPSTNLIPSSQTPLLSLSSFYERQFFFAKKVSEILFFLEYII